MPQVALKKTCVSPDQTRQAYQQAYAETFETEPNPHAVAYGWAVAHIESGGMGKEGPIFCPYNYNYGNIKCFERCREIGMPWVSITPALKPESTEPPIQRAYGSPVDGAGGFWRLLSWSHYDGVLDLAKQGKFYDAAWLMGERGYYDPTRKAAYAKATEKRVQIYEELYGALPPVGATPEPTFPKVEPLTPAEPESIWAKLALFAVTAGATYLLTREIYSAVHSR